MEWNYFSDGTRAFPNVAILSTDSISIRISWGFLGHTNGWIMQCKKIGIECDLKIDSYDKKDEAKETAVKVVKAELRKMLESLE